MARHIAPVLLLGLAAAAGSGCRASAPARFYTLDAIATADELSRDGIVRMFKAATASVCCSQRIARLSSVRR